MEDLGTPEKKTKRSRTRRDMTIRHGVVCWSRAFVFEAGMSQNGYGARADLDLNCAFKIRITRWIAWEPKKSQKEGHEDFSNIFCSRNQSPLLYLSCS